MAEPVRRRRRRAVALGIPAAIVAVLAIVALWRVGGTPQREAGATATIGLNPDRRVSLEKVEIRQLTSARSFWAGDADGDPVFVVMSTPVPWEPGTEVAVEGSLEAAPEPAIAKREWSVNEAVARAVHEKGVYVRASEVTRSRIK
jgi:hypothetical protein